MNDLKAGLLNTVVVGNYCDNFKIGVVRDATSNVEPILKTIRVCEVIELYYIYIERLWILDSRDNYYNDGNLVPSRRCGYCFHDVS